MCMEKIVVIEKNKEQDFFKKIKWLKVLKYLGYKFSIEYCGKKYNGKNQKFPKELGIIINILNILNSETRREKYELIYDYSCDYLDNEFSTKNLCDFKDNMCVRNRCRTRGVKVSSCCERNKTRVICDKFDDKNKCCTIKSVGCKLFTCYYLREKGIRYRVNDVPYLKYFLSIRQKAVCINSIFKDKNENIDRLMKFYKMP